VEEQQRLAVEEERERCDALEERLEGMTLSSEAAHTYAVELEARLAEAEKDRERLDWLEVQKGKLPGWMIETVSHDLGVMIQNCGAGYEKPETLREAIDAAREET
jgi:hypothetical protein